MDSTTAMDEDTRVSVKEAIAEIKRHDHDAHTFGPWLRGKSCGSDDWEIIATIHNWEVSSKKVMEWLGY